MLYAFCVLDLDHIFVVHYVYAKIFVKVSVIGRKHFEHVTFSESVAHLDCKHFFIFIVSLYSRDKIVVARGLRGIQTYVVFFSVIKTRSVCAVTVFEQFVGYVLGQHVFFAVLFTFVVQVYCLAVSVYYAGYVIRRFHSSLYLERSNPAFYKLANMLNHIEVL